MNISILNQTLLKALLPFKALDHHSFSPLAELNHLIEQTTQDLQLPRDSCKDDYLSRLRCQGLNTQNFKLLCGCSNLSTNCI